MDLEIMHKELYKNSYLTPNDFLDDIHKIVHNATVFANQDTDRHNRALAMLTAAQVSLQDFDPQFRIDCQRMAVRERKRREDFRREREKEKVELKELPARRRLDCAKGVDFGGEDAAWMERKDLPMDYETPGLQQT